VYIFATGLSSTQEVGRTMPYTCGLIANTVLDIILADNAVSLTWA